MLDRHILGRFIVNFAILFALLFLFAIAIDIVLALDKFMDAGHELAGEDAGWLARTLGIARVTFGFQAPRLFQFYAYLHGLVAVGAMGFTLAQMHRHRELVAILASGISMHRIAMPFVVGIFTLSAVQLLNHELLLPRVAPLLIRDHGTIGQAGVEAFPIRLTADGARHLLQAQSFDPTTGILHGATILERDEKGRTRRRITAEQARWAPIGSREDGAAGWQLEAGHAVTLEPEAGPEGRPIRSEQVLDFFATDLSPEVLTAQRFGEFVSLLSLRQITRMLGALHGTGGGASRGTDEDRDALLRHRYARFSSVLVDVLIMWLTLPAFLLREPTRLLSRALLGAAIAVPAFIGSAIFMMMPLANIPPAASVFMPVAVLVPVVLGQWTTVKT